MRPGAEFVQQDALLGATRLDLSDEVHVDEDASSVRGSYEVGSHTMTGHSHGPPRPSVVSVLVSFTPIQQRSELIMEEAQ